MDEEAIRQENEARLAELRRQTDAAIEAALDQSGVSIPPGAWGH